MRHSVLTRSTIILIATLIVAVSLQNVDGPGGKGTSVKNSAAPPRRNTIVRPRTTPRPGFFKTFFSAVYEQFVDTKRTYQNLTNTLNNNFLPDNAPVTQATPIDLNVSTTKVPFKITRAEFNKILRRNLLGIARLYNLELKDALKQSDKTWAEFKKNASVEVSKYL